MDGGISVVVPTRNSGAYLRPLLEGFTRAVCQPDEFVFVDGESTDETRELIAGFASSVPVRVFSRRPGGVYDAWNYGIAQARHEWVWVVCSDDLIYPSAIDCMRQLVGHAPKQVGFISWDIDIIDSNGRPLGGLAAASPLRFIGSGSLRKAGVRSSELEAALIYWYRAYYLSFMSMIFRKRVWEELPFSIMIGPPADVDWALRAHLRGWKKMYIPECLAAWRVQPGATTSGFKQKERLAAHAKLREDVFLMLAERLCLSEPEVHRWRGCRFGHDVYDWVAVLKQARSPIEAAGAVFQIIRILGGIGLLSFLAQKCGMADNISARRTGKQFEGLVGSGRLRDHIGPI